MRAPGRAGLFTLKRGDELLVRGAAQFADARQGDFKNAETFFVSVPGEREAAIERNTRADPWVPLWLGLIAAALLWSWWSRQSGGVPRGGGVPSPRGDQRSRGEGTPPPGKRTRNVITFAPDGARGVAAYVEGHKTASA